MACRSLEFAFVFSLFMTLGACSEADLGERPFLCNNGVPECPEGYSCDKADPDPTTWFCLKDGTNPPLVDLGADALIHDLSSQRDGQITPDTGPPLPFVVITEFLADPLAVGDEAGEWFELHNGGNLPVSIEGWMIKDESGESHRISASIQIPKKAFIVLAANGDKATNGGVDAAYAYGYNNFRLSNNNDDIILLDKHDREVDRVTYSTVDGYVITEGSSLSVAGNPFGDKSKASAWCTETTVWQGSSGDRGSPGKRPGCP